MNPFYLFPHQYSILRCIGNQTAGLKRSLGRTLAGALLLFTAQSLTEPDTLKVLTAVLNTNFWLATHVLCITAGYAWCLVVSLMAHLWLYKTMMQKDASALLGPIRIFTLVALLFTAVEQFWAAYGQTNHGAVFGDGTQKKTAPCLLFYGLYGFYTPETVYQPMY